MFLRPSLLPSSSSFSFEIGQRKPDTPRPTSKSFCLNPSRLSLNPSTSTRKLVIFLKIITPVIIIIVEFHSIILNS